MQEHCDSNPQDPQSNARNRQLNSGREREITGLGVIAALIIAFWSLVGDGTLLLSQYLVFVSLLLISAAGMVWRIWKLSPGGELRPIRLKSGRAYRVTFGARGARW